MTVNMRTLVMKGKVKAMALNMDVSGQIEDLTDQYKIEEISIPDGSFTPQEEQEEMVGLAEMDQDHFSWEEVYDLNGCSSYFG